MEFSQLLQELREKAEISQNDLAHKIKVDPSYISRLETGKRQPPKRAIVDKLAKALGLDFDTRNDLLKSAGYLPIDIEEAMSIHPTMKLLADILEDDDIPVDTIDNIEHQLKIIKKAYGKE